MKYTTDEVHSMDSLFNKDTDWYLWEWCYNIELNYMDKFVVKFQN